METPVLDLRRVSFPVLDAVYEELGPPAWDGWMESGGAVIGVARVRGGVPDDGDEAGRPGVTVWSFAPERLSGVYSGPAHQAVLSFSRRLAEHRSLSVPDAAHRLIGLVSAGGDLVTATVDGKPVPARMFEIADLGWLATSVEPGHAFAAAFFLTPPILNLQRLILPGNQ
jgi:hypothetical protein